MGQINHTSINELLQNDQNLLADLATMFARSAPDHVARLRLAVAERNSKLLEETAHLVKSRLSYFAATELHAIAASLEQDGRSGNLEASPAKLEQLLLGFDELLAELRQLTDLPLQDFCDD